VQNTKPLCKEELLLETLLLLKTSKSEEEELLAGQDATTSPPKAMHTSAEISVQPAAYLQNVEPLGKKELLEEKPLDQREEELSPCPKIFSADSMSDEQENNKPIATTETAKTKTLFINDS
jgi:hypothetical protein